MVGKLCDRAVRTALGIPRRTAAKLAGVAYNTLVLYELEPRGVPTDGARMACEALFTELRDVLDRLELRRERRLLGRQNPPRAADG